MNARRDTTRDAAVGPGARALLALGLLLAVAPTACSSAPKLAPAVTSRAYRGHANDADQVNLVGAHPNVAGTRLDDCQTCHRGATFTAGSGERSRTVTRNACDFCHLILHPVADYQEPQPKKFGETLNPFGRDYAAAGRSVAALRGIAGKDSDGDGATNEQEIAALKYPGDPASKPGQPTSPVKVLTLAQVRALPVTSQFMLMNTDRENHDAYSTYTGVKITDLLAAAGVDVATPGIQGITVIAPDGYLKDIPLSDLARPFPEGRFYAGLDVATRGPACGYVRYPKQLPPGLGDGATIPGAPWAILGYEVDGAPIEPARLDIKAGRIVGDGPFRMVVPQRRPGRPDRGTKHSPSRCNDGDDFDPARDHNAGAMVRGVVAIRVNPLPAGVEDFDYRNGGWAYVEGKRVLVYGFGVKP
jgi:hypothetical protein